MACIRFPGILFSATTACVAAFGAIASMASDTAAALYNTFHRMVTYVSDWLGARVKTVLAKFAPHVLARPLVAIERAKAAVAQVVRRKVVRVEAGWRMCPSI
jgi:hypothetical protein